MTERPTGEEHEETGPVVHDRRRIDPVTGELREPVATPAPAREPSEVAAPTAEGEDNHLVEDVADEFSRQIAERTADLQRLQAEYANYRRRVERDRELIRETAVANVLTNLLPVLDDIGRAREHGELEGGFKSVGESLEAIVSSLGLRSFGKAGEAFDPTVHEAMTHTVSADVTETTCVEVYQPGYRIGDRVVRPARVAVADPEG